jgi:hypothetical protein
MIVMMEASYFHHSRFKAHAYTFFPPRKSQMLPLNLSEFVWTDLIPALHHHNKCIITPHMRVSLSVLSTPSCEGLLYICCVSKSKSNIFFV